MNNNERRDFLGSIQIEKREGQEESRTISGYAVVFDKWSEDFGSTDWGFKEKVSRDAFQNTDLSSVIATFNHNFDNVLARTDSDSLTLTIDDMGMKYSFEAPNTTAGNDLLENVRNGNVKGSSFMFTVDEDTWTQRSGSIDEREITKVGKLMELGPVTVPAYPDTTAAKRSYEQTKTSDFDSEYVYRQNRIKILK